jgi:hypothetical protein
VVGDDAHALAPLARAGTYVLQASPAIEGANIDSEDAVVSITAVEKLPTYEVLESRYAGLENTGFKINSTTGTLLAPLVDSHGQLAYYRDSAQDSPRKQVYVDTGRAPFLNTVLVAAVDAAGNQIRNRAGQQVTSFLDGSISIPLPTSSSGTNAPRSSTDPVTGLTASQHT